MTKIEPSNPGSSFHTIALLAAGLVFVLMLGILVGREGLGGSLLVTLTQGPLAAMVFVAGGGYGWLVLHKCRPADATSGQMAVASVAFGAMLLSTATLSAGHALQWLFAHWVFWPLMGIGLLAAVVPLWRWSKTKSHGQSTLRWRTAICLVAAVVLAMALAGATMPPTSMGTVTGDAYDVASYHLQVPREFYNAGAIHYLPHNTYSNYPLGGEMLFLLAMRSGGGPYAGAYAAQLTHLMWGILAVAALWVALPKERPAWRVASASLLATAPMLIYLSWLAYVELAQLAYLAVAVGLLRPWLSRRDWRLALLIGLMLGGSCGVKYLSVGLIAAPVLVLMLLAALVGKPGGRRGRALAQVVLAGVACLVVMSPWLIRNALNTGNPVFPLATSVFDHGQRPAQSLEMWRHGHASPPLWTKGAHLASAFTQDDGIGWPITLMLLAALAALCASRMPIRMPWAAAQRQPRERHGNVVATSSQATAPLKQTDAMVPASLVILILQVLVWAFATHMPARFLVPALVPMTLIGGWAFDQAFSARPARLGRVLTAGALALVLAGNVAMAARLYFREPTIIANGKHVGLNGISTKTLAGALSPYAQVREVLGSQRGDDALGWPGGVSERGADRLMLIGGAAAWFYPPGTIYSTIWEEPPLATIARQTRDGHEVAGHLRQMGVKYLLVDWSEITRFRRTYGWWQQIDEALIQSILDAGAKAQSLFDAPTPLGPNGRPMLEFIELE